FLKIGNYKIGFRLQMAFLLKMLLILTVGAFALYQMQIIGGLVNEINDHPLTVGYTARDIRGNIYNIHGQLQKIAYAADPAALNELEREVNDLEAQTLSKFDVLQERFLGNMEDVKSARAAFAGWRKLRDERFSLARSEGVGKIDASLYQLEQKNLDEMLRKIQAVIDFSQLKAQAFIQSADAQKSSSAKAMTAVIAATMLLGLALNLLIIRSIAPPLRLIVARMKDIARGDLSHDVEIMQKDEIGELAESFREMQASLRNKAEVASAIAGGDFSQMVAIAGNRDVLGNAINQMTLNLRESKEESDRQDWVKTGRNELHSIIV